MNYSQAISRAFQSLRSGSLWGFTVSVLASVAAVYAVVVGGTAIALGARLTALADVFSSASTPSLSTLTPLLIICGALLGAAIVSLPLALILHGGLVSLTDSAVSGRPVRVADGWSAGARNMGRVFAIEFIIGLVVALAFSVVIGVLVAVIASTSRGSGAGVAFGICGGLAFYLLALLFIVLVVTSYEALAVRYGVIGGRTFADALSAARKAFRVAWKNVFVFALIVIGFGILFQMAVSAVLIALEFVIAPSLMMGAAGTDPSVMMTQFLRIYAVIIPLSFLLSLPWMILQQSLWTTFFRQLTGLDTVAPSSAPPAPTPPAEEFAPESPFPATLPAPPTPDAGFPAPPTPPAPPVLPIVDA